MRFFFTCHFIDYLLLQNVEDETEGNESIHDTTEGTVLVEHLQSPRVQVKTELRGAAIDSTATAVNHEALVLGSDSTIPRQDPPDPKPDLNCPIEVTERTQVMINGKKCLLMQNPETKQLCAYPILPPEGMHNKFAEIFLYSWQFSAQPILQRMHSRTPDNLLDVNK